MGGREPGKEQREQQVQKCGGECAKASLIASEQYENLREREGLGSEKWVGARQCKDH